MKNSLNFLLLALAPLFSCQNEAAPRPLKFVQPVLVAKKQSLQARFSPPTGFVREALDSNSYGAWLRNLPLKAPGAAVHLYDGQLKSNQSVHAAVVEMDIGNKNLLQCADASMRLWAEYCFQRQRFGDIHFNLTNGFRMDFEKWAEGFRVKVDENRTEWVKKQPLSRSYATFRAYLDFVFQYAGSFSLSRELPAVSLSDLQIGDIFIQGGSPGHVVVVLDVVKNAKSGAQRLLLGQSYMPAQEFHVLKNLHQTDISPWFELPEATELATPEWTFRPVTLRRFGYK